jgi:quercetin dioxygenase-like cupin family protein
MQAHDHGNAADLPEEQPYEGVVRRSVSSEHSTVTYYEFAPGASFPIHRHASEQITLIQEGGLEFTVDGTPTPMGPGEWSVVAPGIEHGVVAGPQGARFVAVVTPKRQSRDDYEVVGS